MRLFGFQPGKLGKIDSYLVCAEDQAMAVSVLQEQYDEDPSDFECKEIETSTARGIMSEHEGGRIDGWPMDIPSELELARAENDRLRKELEEERQRHARATRALTAYNGNVPIQEERRSLAEIAPSDPAWVRLEGCRRRLALAGKLDLLPMIFAIEEFAVRTPPEAEWKPYGQNLVQAVDHLRRHSDAYDGLRRTCNKQEDQIEQLENEVARKNRALSRARAKLRNQKKPKLRKPGKA